MLGIIKRNKGLAKKTVNAATKAEANETHEFYDFQKESENIWSMLFSDLEDNENGWETLNELLERIFGNDNAVKISAPVAKPPVSSLEAVTKHFPRYEKKEDFILLSNKDQTAAIQVTAGEIIFKAAPAEEGAKALEFNAEAALAMAWIAARDPEMLAEGIELVGSPEEQKLLRAAVQKVNAQLPDGLSLKILDDETVAPALKKQKQPEQIQQPLVAEKPVPQEVAAPVPSEKEEPAPVVQPPKFLIDEIRKKNETTLRVETPTVATEPEDVTEKGMSRRSVLFKGAAVAAAAAVATVIPTETATAADIPENFYKNRVQVLNPHTQETMVLDLNNVESCRAQFNHIARDWRQGIKKEMDTELLEHARDIVRELRKSGKDATQLVLNSGYRSPKTNKKVGGVDDSQHLEAKAMDIRVSGCSAREVYNAACAVVKDDGGIGFYPKKGFVHVDTADGRRWVVGGSLNKGPGQKRKRGKGSRKRVGRGRKRKYNRASNGRFIKATARKTLPKRAGMLELTHG